jgi:hypothetical protein
MKNNTRLKSHLENIENKNNIGDLNFYLIMPSIFNFKILVQRLPRYKMLLNG